MLNRTAQGWLLAGMVGALGLAVFTPDSGWLGQSKAAGPADKQEAKPPAKFRGRLPAYYGEVVTDEQRDKIYRIQQTYAEMIEDLNEQLKALATKRDAEVEGVLTSRQLKRVNELRTAARTKREPAVEAAEVKDEARPEAKRAAKRPAAK